MPIKKEIKPNQKYSQYQIFSFHINPYATGNLPHPVDGCFFYFLGDEYFESLKISFIVVSSIFDKNLVH